MTISSTNRKAGPYSGNGSTAEYPFEFRIFAETDVVVTQTDATGVETVLASPASYTVTMNADQDEVPGGVITLVSVLPAGYLLTATSSLPYLQPIDLTNLGGFYPKVINAALDRLTIQCQQLNEQVGRAVKIGISSSANPDDIIAGLGSAADVALQAVSDAGIAASAASASATAAQASATAAAASAASAASVTPTNIADGAVSSSAKMADGVVTETKLATAAVTTAKVAANAITTAKLSREGVAGRVLTSNGAGADPSYQEVAGVPAGSVIFHAANTPPTGWLKANGAAISRATYAALFAAIGTTFGTGDGSTTFNIPDLRGEFMRGWDDARGVDSGRAFGSAQSSQNLSHNHGGLDGAAGSHSHTIYSGNAGASYQSSGDLTDNSTTTTSTAPNHQHSISSDGGTEARPRNIALLACIKY